MRGIRASPLGPPEWAGAVPLDDHTLGVVSEGDRSMDIGQWHVIGGADTWAADLKAGVMRRIAADASLEDVAPDGTRMLLFELAGRTLRLRVVARDGRAIATMERPRSVPHAAFLDDGTVAVADGSRIGVWDPDSGTSTWSDLADGLEEAFVVAVGDVVVLDSAERAALVDPRSGRTIGEPWRGAGPAAVAPSPDGSRFALAVGTPGTPRGSVELRDAATGRILAAHPGRLLTTVESIAWPSDEVVIVMRAPTGTGQTAVPEFHLADDFGAAPVAAEPFVDAPAVYVARRDLMAAFGSDGRTLLLRVVEARR
jgi:hypothetical protein